MTSVMPKNGEALHNNPDLIRKEAAFKARQKDNRGRIHMENTIPLKRTVRRKPMNEERIHENV